jgi:hypothetical protein
VLDICIFKEFGDILEYWYLDVPNPVLNFGVIILHVANPPTPFKLAQTTGILGNMFLKYFALKVLYLLFRLYLENDM